MKCKNCRDGVEDSKQDSGRETWLVEVYAAIFHVRVRHLCGDDMIFG